MDVATLNKFASLRAKEAPAPVAGGPPPPQTGEFSWRRFANDKEALEEWVDSLLRVGTQELERMASDEAERAAGASGAAATPTRSKGARAASAARRGAAPLSASTRIGATDAAAAATTSAAEEYVRTREVVDAMARISGIFGSCFEELCGHCAVYSARTAALLTRTWGAQTALVAAASKRLVEQEKRVRSLRRETLGVVESASAKAEQARLAFDWHATGLHEVEVELVHKDARLSTTERQVELLTEENARLRALLAADVFATAAEDGEEEDGGSEGGSGAAQASEQAMKQLEQQMLTLWKSSQKVSSELDAKFQSMEKERARQEHLFGKIRATLDAVTMQTMGMVVTAIEGDGSTAEIGVQTAFDGTHSAEHVVFGGEAPPPIPTTGLRAPAPAHIPLELRPLMASYPHSPRIKSVELLDRLILEYYTEKIASDSAHAKAGTALFTPCEFLYAFLSNRYGLHSLTDPHVVEIAQSVAHHARTSSRVGLFARFIGAGTGAYGSAPELDRRAMDFVLLLLNNLQREGVVTLATGLTNSSGDSAATNGANLEIARSGAIRIVRALGNDPGLTPVKRAQRMRKNSDLPERSITTLATRVERLATPPSGSTRKCLLDDFVNCAVAVWLEDHLRRRRKLQEIFSMYALRLIAVNGFVLVHHKGDVDDMDFSTFRQTRGGAESDSEDEDAELAAASATAAGSSEEESDSRGSGSASPVALQDAPSARAVSARRGAGGAAKKPGNSDAVVTFVLDRERFHLAMRAVMIGKRDNGGVLDEIDGNISDAAVLAKKWDAWFDAAVAKTTSDVIDSHRLLWTHHVDPTTQRSFMFCQRTMQLRWEPPVDPYVPPEIDYACFCWLAEQNGFI